MTVVPFACPGCGEERLVEVDAASRGWFCQVCGRSGVVPAAIAASASAPTAAPAGQLHALLLALVHRHLTPGVWQVVAIAPLPQWPRGLQKELTQTLGALPESVVLVLERVPS
jgi:hypothetical protein